MTAQDYARVKEVFLRASELPEPRRGALLDEVFPREQDKPLRAEVESLLAHHQQSERLLDLPERRRQKVPAGGIGSSSARTIPLDQDDVPRSPRISRRSSTHIDHGRFTPGTVLAERYRIVALLGSGGMGEVYRADDLKLHQVVALKFLSTELATDEKRLRDLHEEVRVARTVSHPNVCRVYDIAEVGTPDGVLHHFISMEYVDGENLEATLRRIGRLPEDKAIEIARQLCNGLAAIHDQGLLHRDLKPTNILIDSRGVAKIADFGLAALGLDDHGTLTAGTPGYMAPEVLKSEGVSVRSEVYALGLVLYEMFTGVAAYRGQHPAELLRLQRETDPALPSTILELINPAVERVIEQCLERDPARRPSSARIVGALLPGGDPLAVALERGEMPSPEMVAAAGAVSARSRRWVGVLLSGLVIILVAITALSDSAFLIPRAALRKPPDVLLFHAREIIREAGWEGDGGYQAWGFSYDPAALRKLTAAAKPGEAWDAMRRGRHGVIQFWLRSSSRPLIPRNPFSPDLAEDPPPTAPGSITVHLDATGRLVEFLAVPSREVESAVGSSGTVNWDGIFKAAGQNFDEYALGPPQPNRLPPVYADSLHAWDRLVPDADDVPMHIDSASLGSRLVYFSVETPWSGETVTIARGESSRLHIAQVLDATLSFLTITAGVVLAWRNLRTGRGDRRGAMRLAIFVFVTRLVSWALDATYVAEPVGMSRLLMANLAGALYSAGVSFVYYVALEPYVRRVWPHTLISWSRLLSGRFADPLVGRDMLLGTFVGAASILLLQLESLIPKWVGWGEGWPVLPAGQLEPLEGTRHAAAMILFVAVWAIYLGLGSLLLVVVCRVLTRLTAVAVIVPSLVYASIFSLQSAHPALSWIIWMIIWIAVTLLLVRVGLVAWLTAAVVGFILTAFPITQVWSAWYAGQGIFALILVLAIGLYGLITALGRERGMAVGAFTRMAARSRGS